MRQPNQPRAEVLVLRAWTELHRSPLRIRILAVTMGGESTSTIVPGTEEALAIVAEWLNEWEMYGQHRNDPEPG